MKKHLIPIVCILSIVLMLSSFSVTAESWTMFQHDAQHSGSTSDPGPMMDQIFWDSSDDQTITSISYSSPCFTDGRMYIGCMDGSLLCVDAFPDEQTYEQGDPDEGPINDPSNAEYDFIWRFMADDAITSSPLVHDGKVYFGSQDGNVYCIYSCIGTEIDHYATSGPVSSSPIIEEEYLYVGSEDGNLYCINTDPFGHTWTYPTGASVRSSPAISNNIVVIGNDDGDVYGVHANNGSIIWSYPTGAPVRSSPVIYDNKVYVGAEDGTMHCINLNDGSYVWQYATGDSIIGTPTIQDNILVFGTTNGHVFALESDDKDVVWDTPTIGDIYSSSIIAGNKVYIASGDQLWCFNLSDGVYQWSSTALDDEITSSPAVLNGHLFIASNAGSLYCFRNHNPPDIPNAPDGQHFGIVGQEYEFVVEATDPEHDFLYYQIDWGDGKTTEWLGPYDSGQAIVETHEFSQEGNHSIRVKAKDRFDYESEWSEPLFIDIGILDITDIRGGIGLRAKLENKGSRQLWKIKWNIEYEGGRVLNPANDEFSGEILNLASGETIDIGTGPFFEFGRIKFTIDVLDKDDDNAYSVSLKAFALGFIVIKLPW